MKKKIVSAFLVLVMAALCMASVSAAGTGSLTVKYADSTGNLISGAELVAYQVSDMEGKLTSDFADAKVDLKSSNASAAVTTLQNYIRDRYVTTNEADSVKIQGTAFKGNEALTGLEAGTYLVVEQTPAPGYNGISGRLVQLGNGEKKDVSVSPSKASGSLNVTYKTSGAELVAYRVADMEGNLAGAFADVQAKLTNFTANDTATVLGQIQKFQNFLNDPANAAVKDSGTKFNGNQTISGLASGIYLVLETKAASESKDANPMLVKVDIGQNVTVVAKNTPTGGGGGGTNVQVQKVWADSNDPARPVSITVSLLSDGKEVEKVTLDASNSWKHWFNNLAQGHTYTVEEVSLNGYVASYTTTVQGNTTYITVTNTKTPNEHPSNQELTVRKDWKDANGNAVTNPTVSSITVDLYERATTNTSDKVVATATLSKANNWTYTFKGLDNNKTYYVVEKEVNGYIASYTNQNGVLVVTNQPSSNTQYTRIPVEKRWADGNDKHTNTSITVNLVNSSNTVIQTATLNAANNWKYTFENLPLGTYTVVEIERDGYYATYQNNNGTVIITNTPTTPNKPTTPNNGVHVKIPQTGMTMWPVPVMMAGGVALVAIGMVLNRKRKGNGEQA